jgi:hypothetical protein
MPESSLQKKSAFPINSYAIAKLQAREKCARQGGGFEPLHVSMPRELKSRPSTSPTHPGSLGEKARFSCLQAQMGLSCFALLRFASCASFLLGTLTLIGKRQMLRYIYVYICVYIYIYNTIVVLFSILEHIAN